MGTVFAPTLSNVWAKLAYISAVGAASGGITTGSWNGALQGAFTSTITAGVGGAGMPLPQQALANAFVGGAVSAMQGGKFGHGFVSAGLGTLAGPTINANVSSPGGQIVAHALVGGSISAVTGGKFANGAATGAFRAALAVGRESQKTSGGAPSAPPADTAATGSGSYPKFMADEIVARAQQVFGVLYQAGEFSALGFDYIDQSPFFGPDSWQFDASYVDQVPFYEGYGNLRGEAYVYSGGISIFPGGVTSPKNALGTYAHEVLHFKPEYVQAWTLHRATWGATHARDFWQIEMKVLSIARQHWHRYADQYGEWP